MEGETVDNKRRLEALKQLETLIEEEKVEQEKSAEMVCLLLTIDYGLNNYLDTV